MAFLGFAVSLVIGLWVGNPFITVVTRALAVLFLFYILGCVLAGLGQKVIVENFEIEAEIINAKAQTENDEFSDDVDSENETSSINQVSESAPAA